MLYCSLMCGRYALKQVREAEEYFRVHPGLWRQSYNIAPTQPVPVVRSENGERHGLLLRWGLIPFFAHGVSPKFSTINARMESIETAPTYRSAWERQQRCIQVASGFYEWHTRADGRRVPFYIECVDQPVFGFAALWDRSFAADGQKTESVAHITMPGNALLRSIHNGGAHPFRMPAILRPEDHEAWLTGTPAEARAALKSYDAGLMLAWPVSTRVNSPKNDDAQLLERVDDDTPEEPAQSSLDLG